MLRKSAIFILLKAQITRKSLAAVHLEAGKEMFPSLTRIEVRCHLMVIIHFIPWYCDDAERRAPHNFRNTFYTHRKRHSHLRNIPNIGRQVKRDPTQIVRLYQPICSSRNFSDLVMSTTRLTYVIWFLSVCGVLGRIGFVRRCYLGQNDHSFCDPLASFATFVIWPTGIEEAQVPVHRVP
jgi:hypothetical protein